jgi:predicted methyltransferase
MIRTTLCLMMLAPFGCRRAPPGVASPAAEPAAEAPAGDPIAAALASSDRPAADRARDADRKPAEVLAFFGVEPGDRVVELMAGRGWYTEVLGRLVGPDGVVVAQNNAYVLERFAEGPLTERLARPGLQAVTRLDAELDALPWAEGAAAAGTYDVVLMVLFYHDTVWMEVDRAAMNTAVFHALEPGGVYGIVDHRAAPGSGLRDVQTLHRIDSDVVRDEILAAGFVLDATSDVLAHPEDDGTRNVFDEGLRGRTDRFMMRFVKP